MKRHTWGRLTLAAPALLIACGGEGAVERKLPGTWVLENIYESSGRLGQDASVERDLPVDNGTIVFDEDFTGTVSHEGSTATGTDGQIRLTPTTYDFVWEASSDGFTLEVPEAFVFEIWTFEELSSREAVYTRHDSVEYSGIEEWLTWTWTTTRSDP